MVCRDADDSPLPIRAEVKEVKEDKVEEVTQV